MDTKRFEMQNSLEANYLCVNLKPPFQLDQIVIRVLKENFPEFLVPYQLKIIDDQVSFQYELVNGVALEYSNMILSKDLFIKMYKNLLMPFIEGGDWFLDYHHLCVDPRYIYLNKSKVYFIYVPEESFKSTDQEIISFLKKIFEDVTITDDKDFQIKLYKYFANGNVTLSGLYQLILEEAKAALILDSNKEFIKQKKMPQTQEGKWVKTDKQEEEKKQPVDIAKGEKVLESNNDKIMDVLFGEKKKKDKNKKNKPKVEEKISKKKEGGLGGLFKKKKEKVQVVAEELKGTGAIGTFYKQEEKESGLQPYTEETEIANLEENYLGPYLELVYSEIPGAPAKIELNFQGKFIVIGRVSNNEVRPDIAFPGEFKRIGRRHARIEKKEGEYYLIDLGSVNHTFINGKILVPNQPYHLCHGMEIQFTESKPVRYRVHN